MCVPSEAIAVCPQCNTENDVIAAGVARDETVGCSRCGFTLGLWGDLVDALTPGLRSKRYEAGHR
ncbi:MAG: hypothetical protein AB7O39_00995 [Flavobacteriaceae bacterium]